MKNIQSFEENYSWPTEGSDYLGCVKIADKVIRSPTFEARQEHPQQPNRLSNSFGGTESLYFPYCSTLGAIAATALQQNILQLASEPGESAAEVESKVGHTRQGKGCVLGNGMALIAPLSN